MAQEQVKVFVEVRGGVVQNIDAPSFVDVETIDWDDYGENPQEWWDRLSQSAKDFVTENYPDDISDIAVTSKGEE